MSETTDIKSTLMYGTNNKIRPYFYAYQRSEEERKSSHNESDLGGETVGTEVTVKDGRKVDGISLNKNSFEFVNHETSLSTEDFYEEDQQKVKETYYAEIAELMKKHTGAAHVMIFHHQVRNQEKANGNVQNLNTSVQGYANGIHSDSSKEGAEDLFIQTVNNDEFEKYKSGRFLYLNAWRNISDTPIGNNHLAVCDETSLASPDDYIPTDLFMAGTQVLQYRLSNRNSDQHRWYYYPQMKKNEVILFKQWDSDTTLKGRLCFHTAFQDPNALDDIPPRQSIEARGICFFPDHEPNTCPILTEPEVGGDDEKLVKTSVDKICGAFQYINMFPAEFKPWFLNEASKGVTGIKTIAESFAKDEKGYFGCKKASEETKKKIVAELMKGDKIGIEIRKAVEKLTKKKNTEGGTVQSLVSKGVMVAIGGVLGYMLKASMNTFEQEL